MLAQRLGIDDFETLLRHPGDDLRHVHELAAREDVIFDEVAKAAAQTVRPERIVRDAVVQHEPARRQDPPDLAEILGKPRNPYMLEHADARDLVVERVLRQVEIVAQLDAHAATESACGDLAFHVLELVARQRDPGRVDAVHFGRPEQQRSPAAADVEEPLAGSKPKLAADVVELGCLRIVQSGPIGRKIGARVDHPPIEPEPIERVRYVVVVADVGAVAAPLVPPDAPARRERGAAMRDLADHALGDRGHAPRAAGEVDVLLHIGPRQRAQRRRRERLQPAPGASGDLDLGFGRQRNPAAVGQHQRHRQVAPGVTVGDDLLQRLSHQCARPPM